MKLCLLFICSLAAAQDLYQGEITFDYSGTINGSFSSTVQDSNTAGFAFNQEGTDTSYFILAFCRTQHFLSSRGHGTSRDRVTWKIP